MRKIKTSKSVKKASIEWKQLDLATKALLLIGIVLLLELVYNILFNNTIVDSSYGVVFRTSLSSIFGYIFGMNVEVTSESKSNVTGNAQKKEEQEDINLKPNFKITTKGATVIVLYATGICIMSILTIVSAQNLDTFNYAEGLVQLRNMISLTIGYLVSQANKN